mgnify:CR=1 FL=1
MLNTALAILQAIMLLLLLAVCGEGGVSLALELDPEVRWYRLDILSTTAQRVAFAEDWVRAERP